MFLSANIFHLRFMLIGPMGYNICKGNECLEEEFEGALSWPVPMQCRTNEDIYCRMNDARDWEVDDVTTTPTIHVLSVL